MINAPLPQPDTLPGKIMEVIRSAELDNFEQLLESDPELEIAYGACMRAAGTEWTDEQLAESVFRQKYGDNIDDLMQAWRWQQHLLNPDDPEHARAAAVHIAVKKWQRRQKQARA